MLHRRGPLNGVPSTQIIIWGSIVGTLCLLLGLALLLYWRLCRRDAARRNRRLAIAARAKKLMDARETREGVDVGEDIEAAAQRPPITPFLISSPFDARPIPEVTIPAKVVAATPRTPITPFLVSKPFDPRPIPGITVPAKAVPADSIRSKDTEVEPEVAVMQPTPPPGSASSTSRPRLYARALSSSSSLLRREMLIKLADLARSRSRALTKEEMWQIQTPSSPGALGSPSRPAELESNSSGDVSRVGERISKGFALAREKLREVGCGKERFLLGILGGEDSTDRGTTVSGTRQGSLVDWGVGEQGRKETVRNVKGVGGPLVVLDGTVLKPLRMRKTEGGWT